MTSYKIGIDVDDTVLDLIPRWLELYNKAYKDILRPEQITSWDISKFAKAGMSIYNVLQDSQLYYNILPINGVYDAIDKLYADGYDIYFITSQDHPQKFNALYNMNLIFDRDHYIVREDKWNCDVDLLVDDKADTIRELGIKTTKRGILFTRPHNKEVSFPNIKTVIRCDDWKQVYDTIKYCLPITKKQTTNELYNYDKSKGGIKHDQDKDLWALLPVEATREIVKVMTYGAKKYEPYNWAKGMPYSRVYSALQRHLAAWWIGEDKDEETKLSHLAHAGCCLLFLLSYELWNMKDQDDRFRRKE